MTKRGRGRIARLALAALLLAGAANPREVGFVEAFRGAADGYRIERGAAHLPVRVLTPLHEGDVVHVRAAQGRIELRLASGRAIVLEGGSAPFHVTAPPGEHTVSMNIVRWLGDWVRGASAAETGSGVSLVTRGSGALTAPLLADGLRLGAGSRASLALAWSGGAPPFAVRVADAEGRTLAVLETPAPSASTGPLTLAPGTLELRLRDAEGAEITARAEVVAALPAAPPAVAAADLPASLRETLAAAWLAQQEAGAWRLEAFQSAAALAASYPPALALRDALAAGVPAPPLAEAAGAAR